MNACGYDGTATAALVGFEPVWTHTDARVHISAELLNDAAARGHVTQKYLIREWCGEAHAYHADLKETQ